MITVVHEERQEKSSSDVRLWVYLGSISTKIQYGYTDSAKKQGNVKFLRITDIQEGRVNWSSVPYCDISNSKLVDRK